MEIVDNGPEPNVFDLETATEENTNYRTTAWTGKYLQVTLMSIPVGESIGLTAGPCRCRPARGTTSSTPATSRCRSTRCTRRATTPRASSMRPLPTPRRTRSPARTPRRSGPSSPSESSGAIPASRKVAGQQVWNPWGGVVLQHAIAPQHPQRARTPEIHTRRSPHRDTYVAVTGKQWLGRAELGERRDLRRTVPTSHVRVTHARLGTLSRCH